MCSANEPNSLRSTVPTRNAGSSVSVAVVTPTLYNVVCIVVNPSIRTPLVLGWGSVTVEQRRYGDAGAPARRRRPGRGVGQDRQQRGEPIPARVAGDAGPRAGRAGRDRLPAEPVRAQP